MMACNGSLYRNVCISSLSSYPGASSANLSELAGIAVVLSLNEAEQVSDYIADLKNRSNDGGDRDALQDCVELYQDTVAQLNTSASKLENMNSNSFANDIADVQTWISAALTNPSTCIDGLGEANKNIVPVVNAKTEKSTEFMSNALAVINKLSDVSGGGNYPGSTSRTRRLLFTGDLRPQIQL
jgi:pectinesterase inhibitor-like protein